ncbi:NTP transferase domain-containing protein [Sphingomonas sp. HDW15A]|uniref:nucleotidyltransferase family protein n=1 Tax=Sphingomonas sp. HDW15A TaxID=2714942 RepID=UPI00140DE09D|nr:nucleotidyltransferase family protein [Sphingomonas sp. HDW15A]QIK96778.1 NTP transferase domain-containing protein [Sphingomonas sp. HDW15A]
MTSCQYTALLLAGVRPGGDPFAEQHGVPAKALIPVAGEPMIARPVRALLESPQIGAVRILTQRPDLLGEAVPCDARVTFGTSGATIAATLEDILADPATTFPLLVTTADHALLTPAMIGDFCEQAAGADIAVGVVERKALMARLPHSIRTWIALKGGAYSGANLFALGSPASARAVALWREVEQDRKKGWKLLAALGLPGLLGLLRLRRLDQVITAIGRRLGIEARAVVIDDALAAVDVDKPADLALAEAIIQGRA